MIRKITLNALGASLLLLLSNIASAGWGANPVSDNHRPNHSNSQQQFQNTNNIIRTDAHSNDITNAINACGAGYCVIEVIGGANSFSGFELTRSKTKIVGKNNPIIRPLSYSTYIDINNASSSVLKEIVIDGLTLQGNAFANQHFIGIHVTGKNIKDITITNISANGLTTSTDGHIIMVSGEGGKNESIQNVTVSNNKITNTKTGSSENITIVGNVKNWIVNNNTFKHINNTAIDAIGGEHLSNTYSVDAARYGFIENNKVTYLEDPLDDTAPAIYIDGARHILVQGNEAQYIPSGFAVGAEECAIARHITMINNSSKDSLKGSFFAGAFYDDNNYTGYNRNSSPYSTFPCRNTENDRNINGKGYVEYITIKNNTFTHSLDNRTTYLRLTHAVIQKEAGYPEDKEGSKWDGFVTANTNQNSIRFPETGGILKANDDTATVVVGQSITIDVLANDTGSNLSIFAVDNTWTGNIAISNNKLVYNATGSYIGTIDVWYGSQDSNGSIDWAKVSINISNNVTLKANHDTATVTKGQSVTIDVLANDTGNNLSILAVDNTWTGSIAISNNKLVYNATGSYIGTIDVWHGIKDSSGNVDWAKVSINISNGVAFKANHDTATVTKGQSVTIDVLANDTGNNLSILAVDNTWTGNIAIINNKLVYNATGSYIGNITVWYGIQNANDNVSWANVNIAITH